MGAGKKAEKSVRRPRLRGYVLAAVLLDLVGHYALLTVVALGCTRSRTVALVIILLSSGIACRFACLLVA